MKTTRARAAGLQPARFRDGTVSAVGRYSGGKKTGLWKYYLRNGPLKARGRHVHGALDGPWKWFRENRYLEVLRQEPEAPPDGDALTSKDETGER
jgi:antitoxin component YwqK of YwqJK toxin-antitoxin module